MAGVHLLLKGSILELFGNITGLIIDRACSKWFRNGTIWKWERKGLKRVEESQMITTRSNYHVASDQEKRV